jgi:hypothetical protein
MAAETVLLYHPFSGFPYINGLGFFAEGEDGSMAKAVTGLEIVFPDEAVMGNMACVAVSDAAVCAV